MNHVRESMQTVETMEKKEFKSPRTEAGDINLYT